MGEPVAIPKVLLDFSEITVNLCQLTFFSYLWSEANIELLRKRQFEISSMTTFFISSILFSILWQFFIVFNWTATVKVLYLFLKQYFVFFWSITISQSTGAVPIGFSFHDVTTKKISLLEGLGFLMLLVLSIDIYKWNSEKMCCLFSQSTKICEKK